MKAMSERSVVVSIDGDDVSVPEGATLLDACRTKGVATPTLCYLDNLTPVNACRVCVVELEGSRTLVPACSRTAEPGMKVQTDSERVRHSRKLVLELLASSVDTGASGASSRTKCALVPDIPKLLTPARRRCPGSLGQASESWRSRSPLPSHSMCSLGLSA